MKNLYLLDTDKKTIMHYDTKFFLSNEPQISSTINSSVVGKNIYIVSDEKIQPNDWFIDTVRLIISRAKSFEYGTSQKVPIIICEYYGAYIESNCKKIVMTTDLDLIYSSRSTSVPRLNWDTVKWFVDKANDSDVSIDTIPLEKKQCKPVCRECDGSCFSIIDLPEEMTNSLTLELNKEEARCLLNCLLRTSAKGKDLDIGEMVEEKLVKFLNQ